MADNGGSIDFKLYRYNPSMAAAVIFIILFFLVSALHFYQMVRTRTWIFIPFVLGGFCKCSASSTTRKALLTRWLGTVQFVGYIAVRTPRRASNQKLICPIESKVRRGITQLDRRRLLRLHNSAPRRTCTLRRKHIHDAGKDHPRYRWRTLFDYPQAMAHKAVRDRGCNIVFDAGCR